MALARGDIIRKAQLDPTTVNYALRLFTPDSEYALKNVPTGKGSGHHRTFTAEQAFELAVFVSVMDAGFSRANAKFVTGYTSQFLKIMDELVKSGTQKSQRFDGEVFLRIVDGVWFYVLPESIELPKSSRELSVYQMTFGSPLDPMAEDERPYSYLKEFRLNLTRLAHSLKSDA